MSQTFVRYGSRRSVRTRRTDRYEKAKNGVANKSKIIWEGCIWTTLAQDMD